MSISMLFSHEAAACRADRPVAQQFPVEGRERHMCVPENEEFVPCRGALSLVTEAEAQLMRETTAQRPSI
jgi:hypothetical protein